MPLPPGVELKHREDCSTDYPEKLEGEPPQYIEVGETFKGETDYSCSDCGSFLVVDGNGNVIFREIPLG